MIKQGLDQFYAASGQQVCFEKSSLFFSPNVSEDGAQCISSRLGVPKTTELGKYLEYQYHLVRGGRNSTNQKELLQKAS